MVYSGAHFHVRHLDAPESAILSMAYKWDRFGSWIQSLYFCLVTRLTIVSQVLQELTAKEKGDWTPLMAAADSGSVESFHRVLRAIGERGSEQMVRKKEQCLRRRVS